MGRLLLPSGKKGQLLIHGCFSWLRGMEDPLPQEREAGSTVHGSLEELELGDEAFDHAIVLRQSEPCQDGSFVAFHSQDKAL